MSAPSSPFETGSTFTLISRIHCQESSNGINEAIKDSRYGPVGIAMSLVSNSERNPDSKSSVARSIHFRRSGFVIRLGWFPFRIICFEFLKDGQSCSPRIWSWIFKCEFWIRLRHPQVVGFHHLQCPLVLWHSIYPFRTTYPPIEPTTVLSEFSNGNFCRQPCRT